MDSTTNMEMSVSLPLEQSMMTISDVDWKQDPHDLIDNDERRFNQMSEDTSVGVEFTEHKSNVSYQQSWGIYFGQRSPGISDIFSQNQRQFASPAPDAAYGSVPQTPPIQNNMDDLNQSLSVPSKLPSQQVGEQERRCSNLTAKLSEELNREQDDISLIEDDAMSIDDASGEYPKLIKLCIEDLMSPTRNEMNKENITPRGVNRSLFSEISSLKKPKTNKDNEEYDLDSTDLKEAIECAIQRRKSLDPQNVIRPPVSVQCENTTDCADCADGVQTTILGEITQFHRFIHFKCANTANIEDTKQKCTDLLRLYSSKLDKMRSEKICHQTSWLNMDTKQCTFYMLVNDENSRGIESKSSMEMFLEMIKSHSWILPNESVQFSQFVPQ